MSQLTRRESEAAGRHIQATVDKLRADKVAQSKDEIRKEFGGMVNVDGVYKRREADRKHKAKISALKEKGKLKFEHLIRFA